MAKLNASQFAEKWARRTAGATREYSEGVGRVTEAPGVKAAQKAERMLAEIQRVLQEGIWQERVAAVSLQDWKNAAQNKGAGRIAAGVEGAKADVQSFAGELLQQVDQVKQMVDAMPDATLEDRINKSATMQREMAKFRRTARSR